MNCYLIYHKHWYSQSILHWHQDIISILQVGWWFKREQCWKMCFYIFVTILGLNKTNLKLYFTNTGFIFLAHYVFAKVNLFKLIRPCSMAKAFIWITSLFVCWPSQTLLIKQNLDHCSWNFFPKPSIEWLVWSFTWFH